MARRSVIGGVAAAVILLVLSTAGSAQAHCDTMDGPVISQARQALESGDPRPLLSLINEKVHEWIHKYYMAAKGDMRGRRAARSRTRIELVT